MDSKKPLKYDVLAGLVSAGAKGGITDETFNASLELTCQVVGLQAASVFLFGDKNEVKNRRNLCELLRSKNLESAISFHPVFTNVQTAEFFLLRNA